MNQNAATFASWAGIMLSGHFAVSEDNAGSNRPCTWLSLSTNCRWLIRLIFIHKHNFIAEATFRKDIRHLLPPYHHLPPW